MCHGGNLSMFKVALELRGLPRSVVKHPLRNMTQKEEHQFLDALKDWQGRVQKAYNLIK
jgi:dihydrodipicolinate synthase/N-acetylneuraminate lyase